MAIAAALPVTAAQAAEMRYGWCEIQGPHGDPYYQSAILQISHDDDAASFHALEDEFTAFGRQSLGVPDDNKASCWMYGRSISDAEYDLYKRKSSITNDEHKSIQSIGWTGGHAATATADDTRSGPYLTVKTDTSMIDARKKWEQGVLQSQRDDAAARAKQIADAARDRADMQVKLDKLFEAMRKRGSAQ